MHRQDRALPPNHAFAPFRLRPSVQRGILAAKYEAPRPIQSRTIPAVLKGRDVLGLAETGTGKTAAFALPILERLLADGGTGIRALVIAPTRELAMQIEVEVRLLAGGTPLKSMTIYGGISPQKQIATIRRKPDIVIACPGRLIDLMQQGEIRLNRVQSLVLDEADRLFDMGFLPDIRRIIKALPAKRQNLLFSATMPKQVRHLADDILRDPHVVELAGRGPASTIEHALYPVPQKKKFDLLLHLVSDSALESAIVFTRTKHRAKRMAQKLEKLGCRAVALQGNMSQPQRDRAMGGFREGKFKILVATDIAARGIDVLQISHVVNFDMPDSPEAYTHRIGRTGRAEQKGMAYSFITEEDREMVDEIEKMIGSEIPRCPLPELKSRPVKKHTARKTRAGNGPPSRPKGRRRGRSRRRRR